MSQKLGSVSGFESLLGFLTSADVGGHGSGRPVMQVSEGVMQETHILKHS